MIEGQFSAADPFQFGGGVLGSVKPASGGLYKFTMTAGYWEDEEASEFTYYIGYIPVTMGSISNEPAPNISVMFMYSSNSTEGVSSLQLSSSDPLPPEWDTGFYINDTAYLVYMIQEVSVDPYVKNYLLMGGPFIENETYFVELDRQVDFPVFATATADILQQEDPSKGWISYTDTYVQPFANLDIEFTKMIKESGEESLGVIYATITGNEETIDADVEAAFEPSSGRVLVRILGQIIAASLSKLDAVTYMALAYGNTTLWPVSTGITIDYLEYEAPEEEE